MITRPAKQTDLENVAVLFNLYRIFYELEDDLPLAKRYVSERWANGESVVLVAEDEGALVGFCQLYATFCSLEAAKIYSLYDLYVDSGHRTRGIGEALLLAAEQRAKDDGMVRLDLTTARTNHEAQALYERTGWLRDDIYLAYSKRIK